MESKQLNKIIVLIAFFISMNSFSQMRMADIEDKEFSINSKREKRNLIKISDDSNYSVYYIFDNKNFDLKKESGVSDIAKIVFFSKKYNKGVLVNFRQMIYCVKKNIYEINISTAANDKYMFVSSMAILDEDFNYEYFMKYYYMPPPPPKKGNYTSWLTIQDTKNYCNQLQIDIKGNAIFENIDNILSNLSKIEKETNKTKDCNSIIYDIDMRDYFPKKIIK